MNEEDDAAPYPRIRSGPIGWGCLILALAGFAPAFPLHCVRSALEVGGVALLAGGTLGAMLAAITRTRSPLMIYVCLAIAALSFWPLYQDWPPTPVWDLLRGPANPEMVANYFSALRPLLFLVGIPYPYVRWGQHGPDPLPEESEEAAEDG